MENVLLLFILLIVALSFIATTTATIAMLRMYDSLKAELDKIKISLSSEGGSSDFQPSTTLPSSPTYSEVPSYKVIKRKEREEEDKNDEPAFSDDFTDDES